MARPIIALLTDFGTRDHYVGAMKGVVLSICPDVTLVDLSHGIAPHNVRSGSLELAAAYRYFPAGTIFLAVVDPGVGSARRALAADAGGFLFLAPDNGILTHVFQQTPPARVVEMTEPRYGLSTVSCTFEGRDRFAPAAAWLATGVDLAQLGAPLASWHLLEVRAPAIHHDQIVGEVVRVDHFGNLVTNVDRALLDGFGAGGGVSITAGTQVIDRIVTTYGEVPRGVVCALFSSSDYLEVAVNGSGATLRLGLGCGAAVTISRT
jgi:S-adenosyl-L-methionine hydrolase (adenosine-forming)